MELNDINELSLIITLPSDVEWSQYQLELLAAARGQILNFKVPVLPTRVEPGCKCYIVWRGYIRGWMTVCGFSEKEFVCTTTGKPYSGKFIERTGEFYELDEKIPYKGFQGFRYFSLNAYLKDFKKNVL